ncbi:hypothetical protein BDP81DRAFT_428639 [Colletotrichum phormii]|uniref:Uncharacterized protein n=1 Tax=Colletotrichum phormii TaxID=359342 RepID=A0AAI9ZRN7_9PEZI|nr:uncharacterized protein BDP81DRAFT_428639 [Colletotrichum phormii]KAK1636919.1 hypothetical protein BDP81DRAFT_428639 [Colletotrichum phormii]
MGMIRDGEMMGSLCLSAWSGENGVSTEKETRKNQTSEFSLRCQGLLSVLVSRLKYAAVPSISNVGIPYLEGSKGARLVGRGGRGNGGVKCGVSRFRFCVGKVIKRDRWQTQSERESETGKSVMRNGQQERNTILSVPQKEATDPETVRNNGAARAQESD